MTIWVVYSTNLVHGVFSTERKAKSYKALLERDGLVCFITPQTLNQHSPEPELKV